MCLTYGLTSCWALRCQSLGDPLLLVSCLNPVNSSFIKLFSVKLFDRATIFCWDTDGMASLVAQLVKNLPAMQETSVQFLGQEDPLEKG